VDADAIVTCNEREAALLREKFPDKMIVVQAHGVPLPIYQADHRAAARTAFPSVAGRDILLSLGRIDPIKNQAWILDQAPDIFARYPNALLVLAGACTDEPYGVLIEQKIEKLGLSERVLLTGGLPPNDPRLIGLLQEARALILPSLSETFGLVLLEAWAAGTMVLSSRTSGATALIEHGRNGWLFDLDDPRGFHACLDTTMTNRRLCRGLVARGAERVGREYSVHVLAGRMKALYEELAEEKPCAT